MSSIVVTTATWQTDYCPKCGIGPHEEYAQVKWLSALRGICSAGHFVAIKGEA